MSSLLDKIVLIVGAGNRVGIGASAGRMMAARGAKVVLADLNIDGAKALVAQRMRSNLT